MFEKQVAIKEKAKKTLKKNYGFYVAVWSFVWGAAVLGFAIIVLSLVTVPFISPLLIFLVPFSFLILRLGIYKISLAVHKGKTPPFSELFSVFRNPFRNPGGQLWRSFLIAMWGFLCFLPANAFLIYILISENEIIEILWHNFSPTMLPEYYDYIIFLSGKVAIYAFLFILGALVHAIKTFTYSLSPFLLLETRKLSITRMPNISKQMTRGSFWNLCLFFFSFFGWGILTVLTGGLLGILWAGPYFNLSFTEIYFEIRERALQDETCQEAELT